MHLNHQVLWKIPHPRYYKEEITNLTDEIDNIHKNIKEKIDAEVQATDTIMELEKQANRSLDKIADSITAKVHIRSIFFTLIFVI